MALTYKEVEKRHAPNSLGVYLNKVRVAAIYYGALNSRGESKPWRAEMKLPGFKNKVVKVSTPEEGKAHVEACFKNWLVATGLTESEKTEQTNGD